MLEYVYILTENDLETECWNSDVLIKMFLFVVVFVNKYLLWKLEVIEMLTILYRI